MSASLLNRLRLHLTPGIAYKTYQKLLDFYEEEEIFSLSLHALQKVPGVGPMKAEALKKEVYLEQAKRELEAVSRLGIQLILHEALPPLLQQIPDPPLVLYVKGSFDLQQANITMVGTRRCSSLGRSCAFELAKHSAQASLTVVSGLAYGIDTAVHQGALSTGKTLAILGSGLEEIYPLSNQKLAQQICQQDGALLSEFPLYQKPQRENFPRRNRLLAGISPLTLLIEAPLKSGAMITADYALDYGRDLMVVPGPPFKEYCKGSNRLLQEGAGCCLSGNDLLSYYGIGENTPERCPQWQKFRPEEQKVLEFFQNKKAL
jgi:DNA processing protein